MNWIWVIIGALSFAAYTVFLIGVGIRLGNCFNKRAWDKFYEGRDGKRGALDEKYSRC